MKKTAASALAFILLLGTSVSGAADAPEGDKADEKLVRVNKHVITLKELDVHLKVFYLTSRLRKQFMSLPPAQQEQFYAERRKEALRDLINRHLMLEQAKKEYLGQPQIEKAIEVHVEKFARAKAREVGSFMTLHQWVHEHGLSMEEWKALVGDSTLVQHYMWERVGARMHVSPEEIRRYYEEHKEEFRRPRRVIYRMILIDPEGCETAQQEQAKAEAILQKIREGADFAEVAEKHSLDRHKTDGGLREQDAPLTLADWLPPSCKGLQPGEVSEAQRTQAGYSITKLERVVPSRIPPFEEAQVEAREILLGQKTAEARKTLVKKLLDGAHVQYFPAGERMLQ